MPPRVPPFLATPLFLTKLQRLQNKAVCIITNSEIRASINFRYFKLGNLILPELHKLESARLMHPRYKQILLQCFTEFFKPLSSANERQPDQNQKINFIYRNFPLYDVKNLSNIIELKFGIPPHLKLESNRSVNSKLNLKNSP